MKALGLTTLLLFSYSGAFPLSNSEYPDEDDNSPALPGFFRGSGEDTLPSTRIGKLWASEVKSKGKGVWKGKGQPKWKMSKKKITTDEGHQNVWSRSADPSKQHWLGQGRAEQNSEILKNHQGGDYWVNYLGKGKKTNKWKGKGMGTWKGKGESPGKGMWNAKGDKSASKGKGMWKGKGSMSKHKGKGMWKGKAKGMWKGKGGTWSANGKWKNKWQWKRQTPTYSPSPSTSTVLTMSSTDAPAIGNSTTTGPSAMIAARTIVTPAPIVAEASTAPSSVVTASPSVSTAPTEVPTLSSLAAVNASQVATPSPSAASTAEGTASSRNTTNAGSS